MNQIALAAKTALETCPFTSWESEPIYDHPEQRLSVESMVQQFISQSIGARSKVFVMLVQWGLAGRWLQFRNEPVYFVRQILNSCASKEHFLPVADFPIVTPPWKPRYVAAFLESTAMSWYSIERDRWARELATEAFEFQEGQFRSRHPIE